MLILIAALRAEALRHETGQLHEIGTTTLMSNTSVLARAIGLAVRPEMAPTGQSENETTTDGTRIGETIAETIAEMTAETTEEEKR